MLAGLADPQAWSVAFNLGALERASQALRERLSSEQWGQIRVMRESFAAALQADLAAFRPRAKPTLDDYLRGMHPLDPSWRRAELQW